MPTFYFENQLPKNLVISSAPGVEYWGCNKSRCFKREHSVGFPGSLQAKRKPTSAPRQNHTSLWGISENIYTTLPQICAFERWGEYNTSEFLVEERFWPTTTRSSRALPLGSVSVLLRLFFFPSLFIEFQRGASPAFGRHHMWRQTCMSFRERVGEETGIFLVIP